jgi:hypothetical protein
MTVMLFSRSEGGSFQLPEAPLARARVYFFHLELSTKLNTKELKMLSEKLMRFNKDVQMSFALLAFFCAGVVATKIEASDIYSRIDACESSGDQSCVFSILRELAGKGNSDGGATPGSTAFVNYVCNDQTSTLDITTRNARTNELYTFSYSFPRYRFSCVSSLIEDLSQVLTIRNQRRVSACDPRSLMVVSFTLSPVASANYIYMSNQFPSISECKQEALRLNQNS